MWPFWVFLFCAAINICCCEKDSLEMIHVLFRHGDRTNTNWTTYPKDPYINETYQPYGIGKLTKEGKLRMLNVGKELRKTYSFLLPPFLSEANLVYAQTTDVNRTKMSLELLMQGFFGTHIKIPYKFSPLRNDEILAGDFIDGYEQLYQKFLETPFHKKHLKKYSSLFKKIEEYTGKNINTFQDVQMVYLCLRSEDEWGLKLPRWTKPFWPETFLKLAILGYLEQTGNDQLKKYTSGSLLKKIIEDTLEPKGRKIFLYSAHEHNLAHVLISLGVFFPHNPPYGAYIVFETHRIKNETFLKVLYKENAKDDARVLKIPNCDVLCQIEDFIRLQEHILPKNDDDDFLQLVLASGSSKIFAKTFASIATCLILVKLH